jgi:hypothetical protein
VYVLLCEDRVGKELKNYTFISGGIQRDESERRKGEATLNSKKIK